MFSVSISEAKKRFYELVRLVEKGERISVTRYGKPFFDMAPNRDDEIIETADERIVAEAATNVGPSIP
jgi:antitoxin (DNA-binding transcriptional repressor) of toxin-antitoxin stability system